MSNVKSVPTPFKLRLVPNTKPTFQCVCTAANERFVPHRAVVTPKKLRIIYDASAHEKGKASLNEMLILGSNLIPELAGVLLRFRSSTTCSGATEEATAVHTARQVMTRAGMHLHDL
ncbi:hypothetical protein niasHS_013657 [Heterodera schachtii]|uniref:Uncharacterized protein n=1 Tax=Heterodera schachtii TaxID=97005 RepID=A0ABD2J0Y9_HETSC